MYMSLSYEQTQTDRIWLAPRVARWMPVQPALIERLNEQWESIVLPAGASPGDKRAPVVLGVHVRGTDTGTGHNLEFDFRAIDRYIAAHEACTIGEPCRRVVILLATDDTGYLNSTQQRYGSRVATQNGGDIQRSSGGAGVWESAVSNALALGEEVVMDTLLLARCDYVLRPASAVSEWAVYMNPVLFNNSFTFGLDNQPSPAWMGDVGNAAERLDNPVAGDANASCTSLAANLSAAYAATDPFEGSTYYQLVEYLSSHGVLFTMCEKYDNCSALARQGPGGADQPWSASWVNQHTGFRYFDADPEGRPLGVVMDPFGVTVRCMYASDGHSHRRDDHGCGPYSVDPAYGSRGETQLRASGQLDTTRRSLLSGLANTSADAIDCEDYYGINLGGSSPNVTAFHPINEGPRACERMKRDGTFVVEAATAAWQRMDAAIAGQPVCTPNDAMHAMSGQFWVYTGACSWAPTEWQSMADIFVNHLLPASEDVPDGAEARHLWNEIIARAPQDAPAERASTLAMFYIRTDNATEVSELRELAMTNADALGGLPVLVIDPTKLASGGPLFTCAVPPPGP